MFLKIWRFMTIIILESLLMTMGLPTSGSRPRE